MAGLRAATFQQSDAGASAIDVIKVMDWVSKNSSAFSLTCKNYLSKADIYVAQDSYRVRTGAYTLEDSTGGGINIKANILQFSADVSAQVTGDSSLTPTVPVYTAVHQAV